MISFEIKPLVSVIVITYNSSNFVTETLDSIREQTYKRLELIVADDFSSDNTIELVQGWIKENNRRFVDVQLVTTDVNTGTSANCNRGIKACHGEWIRIIAGDDLMTPCSIEWQIDYLNNHPEAKILIGERREFKVIEGLRHDIDTIQVIDEAPHFFDLTAEGQYNYILRHFNLGLTSGTIVNTNVYKNVTIYDEKYTIVEDLPFWLNVTKAGIKFYYIRRPLTMYRIHESVSHARKDTLFNKKFADVRKRIIKDMIRPNIRWYEFINKEVLIFQEIKYWLTFKVFNNRRNRFSLTVLNAFDYLYILLIIVPQKLSQVFVPFKKITKVS